MKRERTRRRRPISDGNFVAPAALLLGAPGARSVHRAVAELDERAGRHLAHLAERRLARRSLLLRRLATDGSSPLRLSSDLES